MYAGCMAENVMYPLIKFADDTAMISIVNNDGVTKIRPIRLAGGTSISLVKCTERLEDKYDG